MPYYFLRWGGAVWQRFNPPIHYQSCERHRDYRPLLMEVAFAMADEYEGDLRIADRPHSIGPRPLSPGPRAAVDGGHPGARPAPSVVV